LNTFINRCGNNLRNSYRGDWFKETMGVKLDEPVAYI